jgi:hypothetical protein
MSQQQPETDDSTDPTNAAAGGPETVKMDDSGEPKGYNPADYAIAYVGGTRYRVMERSGGIVATVNLETGEVSDFNVEDGDDLEEYRRVFLLVAMDEHDTERATEWAKAQAPLRQAEMFENALATMAQGMGASGGSNATASASGGSDGDDADDELVTEIDPTDDQQAKLEAFESWINQAAGFHGFDASIVELTWAEVEGREGIVIEANPFQSGYWSDGSWNDKEGYGQERETFTENVLQARDEIEYYGEPDYINFVPESKISEFED